jgi:hypothetical protein
MNESIAISLFKSLTPLEWKRYKRFVLAQAGNNDVAALMEYLYPYYPDFDHVAVDKQAVHAALYPKRTYSDQKIRHLLNDLYQLAEQYLCYSRLIDDDILRKTLMLRELRLRKLDKLFDRQYAAIQQKSEAHVIKNADQYLYQYLGHVELNRHLKAKQQRDIEPRLQQLSDSLDLYYAVSKLKLYSEAVNYSNLVKIEYNIGFVDPLITAIEQGKWPAERLVQSTAQPATSR